MTDIGSQLRQAREAQGLSLDQVQKATRIKRVFIEAIEADRFDELPGMVQVRGFVRSYANWLGLDADGLLAQMDGRSNGAGYAPHLPSSSNGVSSRPNPVRLHSLSLSSPTSPSRPNTLPLPLPVLIIGAILLFIVGGFLIIKALGNEAPPPTPTLPANVPASIARTVAPEVTSVALTASGVELTLTASEHVWVRISGDGFTLFEGLIEANAPQSWQAEQQLIVETGNGAALNVAVNGQSLGLVGPRNRVAIRAWGPEGEVTPAPTAVPSPSTPATAEPAATSTP